MRHLTAAAAGTAAAGLVFITGVTAGAAAAVAAAAGVVITAAALAAAARILAWWLERLLIRLLCRSLPVAEPNAWPYLPLYPQAGLPYAPPPDEEHL